GDGAAQAGDGSSAMKGKGKDMYANSHRVKASWAHGARVRERGMALVFALLGILLLSMLAASLMFITSTESMASFHYKNETQASYAALAGVQRATDWFRKDYNVWLNPTTGTPPRASDPPITPTTYVWNVYPPTYTGSGGAPSLGNVVNFPALDIVSGTT